MLDGAVEGAVGGVALEQQRVQLDRHEVVDGDDLRVRGALDEGLERLAADAAEAVDADPSSHGWDSLLGAPPCPAVAGERAVHLVVWPGRPSSRVATSWALTLCGGVRRHLRSHPDGRPRATSPGRADATRGTVPISPTSSPRAACTTRARCAWIRNADSGHGLPGRCDQALPPRERDATAEDDHVRAEDVDDGDHRDGHGPSSTLEYDACGRIAQVGRLRRRGPRSAGAGAISAAMRASSGASAPASSAGLRGGGDARAAGEGLEMADAATATGGSVHVHGHVAQLAGHAIGARRRDGRR